LARHIYILIQEEIHNSISSHIAQPAHINMIWRGILPSPPSITAATNCEGLAQLLIRFAEKAVINDTKQHVLPCVEGTCPNATEAL
jgi:hypothetical protein